MDKAIVIILEINMYIHASMVDGSLKQQVNISTKTINFVRQMQKCK